jgi:hypothetical protein
MSLVPEFTDDHRAATMTSMSQRSNGHHGLTTARSIHKNNDNGASSALLDVRRWTALLVAMFFFSMNLIVVPVACLCTLFIFLYPIKLFRFVI